MLKKILDAKNPKLRVPAKPLTNIDKKILELIQDLKDTLAIQKDPEGIGLAAPQIGKSLRVFIIKPGSSVKTIINPQIISISKNIRSNKKDNRNKKTSKQNNIMEGCLSLPHFYSPIERAKKIKVKYMDETGKKKLQTFEGLEAHIIQHEIDHLNGILFTDRILEQKKPLYEYVDGEWERVELA